MTNNFVIKKISSFTSSNLRFVKTELRKISPKTSPQVLIKLHTKSIKLHQQRSSNYGKFLENEIISSLLKSNKIPFRNQVVINKDGEIVERKGTGKIGRAHV